MKLSETDARYGESDTANVTVQDCARQLQAATRDGDSCEAREAG
jgi:hypothetical protein